MNLLITHEGVVVGQTLSIENAQRHTLISRIPLIAVPSRAALSKLPKKTIRGLNHDHGAKSLRALWAMLEKQHHPQWGKVSMKKVVRHLYAEKGTEYTRDELLKIIPGATWISITTALSMLKNKKYADGPTMIIRQIDGKYRRTR